MVSKYRNDSVSFLVLHPLLSFGSEPPRFLQSTHSLPVTLLLLNSQNLGSLLRFPSLISLTCATYFPSLFSPILLSRASRQLFTTTSGHTIHTHDLFYPKWFHFHTPFSGYCDFFCPLLPHLLLFLVVGWFALFCFIHIFLFLFLFCFTQLICLLLASWWGWRAYDLRILNLNPTHLLN